MIRGVFTLLLRVFFEEHVLTIPLLKAQGERSTVVWLPQLSLVPKPPITPIAPLPFGRRFCNCVRRIASAWGD